MGLAFLATLDWRRAAPLPSLSSGTAPTRMFRQLGYSTCLPHQPHLQNGMLGFQVLVRSSLRSHCAPIYSNQHSCTSLLTCNRKHVFDERMYTNPLHCLSMSTNSRPSHAKHARVKLLVEQGRCGSDQSPGLPMIQANDGLAQ